MVDYYNLVKIGISDIHNGYKMEYPISNIFNSFIINSIFCIQKSEIVTFLSCNYKEIKECFINSKKFQLKLVKNVAVIMKE